ncbi:unnamed protein product [Rhizophagus irregularis]|nr:unnamed protein product [Rhizophagus irregularis]
MSQESVKRVINSTNVNTVIERALSITDTAINSFGASKVSDSISPFLPLITEVSRLTSDIINIYQTAEHNKRICGSLLSRTTAAETAVKNLEIRRLENESLFKSKEYYKNFQRLVIIVGKIKKFIEEISQIKGLRRFLAANSIEKDFFDLTNEFEGLMRILNFSIAVTNQIQMEEDKKILSHDIKEMNKYIHDIEGGIANEVSGINAKLDDITQWNLAWQKKLLSKNEDIIADATIPMNEFSDPSEMVKRGNKVIKKLRKGEEVALKKRIFDKEEKKQINDILSQVTILKKLKESKYIVKFYGFVNEEEIMYMVTEWFEYGNLKEYYTDYGPLGWLEKSQIAIDISRGLTFLHTVSILHHDIRSENILITRHRCAKLANFTLSRGFRDFSTHVKATIDNVRWMAPEKLKDHNNPYTAKCEIYSFGMVLWEIAEGKLPFQRENDIVQIRNLVVNQKYRPSFSLGVPNEWVKIAYQAMQDSPSARPSLKDIFMTLNDVYQIHKPKKTPTSSPICSPSQSDLPDPDDLELSLDLSVIDIDTLSIKEAIAEHKKNGDRLKAWKAFCQHSELDDMLAKYWKGYYLYYDLCPIEDPEDKNAKQLRVKQSVEYFKEAADFGLADAQLRYGHCLWSGEAIKRDIKESIRYFQMSADNGNHTAMYNIGNILYNGIGANKDEEKGSNYLRLAALSGQPKAIAMCKTKGIKLA